MTKSTSLIQVCLIATTVAYTTAPGAAQVRDTAALNLRQVATAPTDCSYFVDQDSAAADDLAPGTTEALPLKTIQAGVDRAVAGDVICVKPSATAYLERFQGFPRTTVKGIKFKSSGTPGDRIVLTNYPSNGPLAVIDQQFDFSPGINDAGQTANTAPTTIMGIFIEGQDYITINGFEIKHAGIGIKTDPVLQINQGVYDPATGIIIANSHIHNIRQHVGNIGGIVPEGCYDCTIIDNYIHDVGYYQDKENPYVVLKDGTTMVNHNISAIITFESFNLEIVGNTLERSVIGFHFKSWTVQPRNQPGSTYDGDYAPTTNVPPAVTSSDKGLVFHRNIIRDVRRGIFIEPKGGRGRIHAPPTNPGNDQNPGYHNLEIFDNLFYSTENFDDFNGPDLPQTRMSLALSTAVRGNRDQSRGLKFYNNTVIAFDGIVIDAFQDTEIYNNLFSLSLDPSINNDSAVAIRTEYAPGKTVGERLDDGDTLNLGTPENRVTVVGPRAAAAPNGCNSGQDPDLLVAPFVSTPPLHTSAGGTDTQFFCTDSVQWTANITYADHNYYHYATHNQLNRFASGDSIGQNIEVSIDLIKDGFAAWQALDSAEFSLGVDNPDTNSIAPLANPDPNFINGVQLNLDTGIVTLVDIPAGQSLSDSLRFHSKALEGLGRNGENIGAFSRSLYDIASGIAIDHDTQSGVVGTSVPANPASAPTGQPGAN